MSYAPQPQYDPQYNHHQQYPQPYSQYPSMYPAAQYPGPPPQYVAEGHQPPAHVVEMDRNGYRAPPNVVYVVEEDNATCAKVGCICAFFIPLIGCLTWLWNLGAPTGSNRKRWGGYACMVALIMVTIAVLASTLSTQTSSNTSNGG